MQALSPSRMDFKEGKSNYEYTIMSQFNSFYFERQYQYNFQRNNHPIVMKKDSGDLHVKTKRRTSVYFSKLTFQHQHSTILKTLLSQMNGLK